MRHRNAGRKLSRTFEHRKAMFKNMVKSLLTYERIRTTVPKAKELQKFADKLITLSLRGDDIHAKRQAFKVLENHKMVQRLFDEIGPKFKGVPGGFTRVIKLAMLRAGDAAPMAIVELAYPGQQNAPEKTEEQKQA